jgi:hypothetical protein
MGIQSDRANPEKRVKRFHAHVAVDSIEANVMFYSQLFGEPPSQRRDDSATWMLEDPRLNFSISARGHVAGLNHFGFQAESAQELAELQACAEAASQAQGLDKGGSAACCFAKSHRHWTIDPQGLAWEHFGPSPESKKFGIDKPNALEACCIPLRTSNKDSPAAESVCCMSNTASRGAGACCD